MPSCTITMTSNPNPTSIPKIIPASAAKFVQVALYQMIIAGHTTQAHADNRRVRLHSQIREQPPMFIDLYEAVRLRLTWNKNKGQNLGPALPQALNPKTLTARLEKEYAAAVERAMKDYARFYSKTIETSAPPHVAPVMAMPIGGYRPPPTAPRQQIAPVAMVVGHVLRSPLPLAGVAATQRPPPKPGTPPPLLVADLRSALIVGHQPRAGATMPPSRPRPPPRPPPLGTKRPRSTPRHGNEDPELDRLKQLHNFI